MALWRISGGPREFRGTSANAAQLDIEWVWTISDGVQERAVSVEVAAGRLHYSELPDEAWAAIATHGHSAVETVLGAETPPERLTITSAGVQPA
jgi:hypothetical protein